MEPPGEGIKTIAMPEGESKKIVVPVNLLVAIGTILVQIIAGITYVNKIQGATEKIEIRLINDEQQNQADILELKKRMDSSEQERKDFKASLTRIETNQLNVMQDLRDIKAQMKMK